MARRIIALFAVVLVAAGCGSAKSHSTTRSSVSRSTSPPDPAVVTPRQVERAFSRHGVRLVENYPNARPGPIIRADYHLPGNAPNGWVTVYDSVRDAGVAEQRARKVYARRNLVVHANVLVEFLPYANRTVRRQVTRALSAVAR